MIYGQEDEDSLITNYLDAHIETAIKQRNLDRILDIIDNYIDLAEEVMQKLYQIKKMQNTNSVMLYVLCI